MTKAQIIERLKAAGVTGWDKKNLAELEAMAAENGVSLDETTTDVVEDPEALPAESPEPDAPRFITPSMACSRKFFGADPES
jgi:hypothetical protein